MTKVEISVTGKGLKRVISQGHISHVTTHDLQECSWKAWQVPIAQTHPALRFFEVDSCNTMCPYVCCVYCPDPVWIPSVHACVDLSFVSSRQYKNVTIKLYDMRLSARTARSRIHTISVDSTATVFTEYSTGTEGFDHFEPPLALAVCRFAFGGFASPFRLPTACDVNRRGACLVLRAVPTAPD